MSALPDDTRHPAPARSVRVWDLPTRLFHWSLVALLVVSYVSGETENFEIHFLAGYAIITLVVFRLAWGVVGSRTARFADFVKGPRAVLHHAAALLRRDGPAEVTLGHNPLGALMVLALLAAVLGQAVSGLFTSDDIINEGPLVPLVGSGTVAALSTVHRVLIDGLLILAAVHVLAVIAYRVLTGENLVRPMITGRKPVPAGQTVEEPPRVHPLAALLIVAVVAGLLAALLRAV